MLQKLISGRSILCFGNKIVVVPPTTEESKKWFWPTLMAIGCGFWLRNCILFHQSPVNVKTKLTEHNWMKVAAKLEKEEPFSTPKKPNELWSWQSEAINGGLRELYHPLYT